MPVEKIGPSAPRNRETFGAAGFTGGNVSGVGGLIRELPIGPDVPAGPASAAWWPAAAVIKASRAMVTRLRPVMRLQQLTAGMMIPPLVGACRWRIRAI